MLLQTHDPRTVREALPNFRQATHVFLPVNDCRTVNVPEGGTHWSLLLVSIIDRRAFHYDSLPPGNEYEARLLSHKLSLLLGSQIRCTALRDSPEQRNGSDCGVFVCMEMKELLLNRLLRVNADSQISMSLGGMHINASSGRKEMYKLLERLRRAEREKGRSRSASSETAGRSSSEQRPSGGRLIKQLPSGQKNGEE